MPPTPKKPGVASRFYASGISTGVGFGIGAALGPPLIPYTQDLTNIAWSLHPSRPLSADAAASAVVRGAMTFKAAAAEAKLTGTNATRFEVMHALAGDPPGPETLLELRNRGAIDDDQLELGLRQSRLRPEWFAAYRTLRRRIPSAQELAEMAVQGVIAHDDAERLAALVGVDAAGFEHLYLVAGNPPGAGELLNLWNRGDITEQDVDRGLRQSRLKPEWTAAVKRLARRMPSPSDLIRFAVREVYSPEIRTRFGLDDDFPPEFATRAAELGMDAEQAGAYWAAHWELPSTEQGYRMLHRGVVGEPELDLLLRAKDVMPFWRDKLKAIAHLVPGRIDLRRFYAAGVIDKGEVLAGYKALGYSDKHAQWQTDFATREATATTKDLTAAELVDEYEGLYVTRAEAARAIGDLGYSADEVEAKLRLADARRVKAARGALVGRAHTLYVRHRLDRPEASKALDDAGVAPAPRDHLLTLWDAERDINVELLTPAQIKKAFTKGVESREWALAELVDRGYSDADASRLLDE